MSNSTPIFLTALILLRSLAATAQLPDTAISHKFERLCKNSYAEKIVLRTDKQHYLAGETVWWTIYNANGYTNKRSALSKVVYLELLNQRSNPVWQATAAVDKEGSNGSFVLPPLLGSGTYTFRAYTNWMKNFGEAYFFRKNIEVLNAEKGKAMSGPDSALQVPQVGFYPEGGSLVRNLPNTLAFRITDAANRNHFKGWLVSNQRDTLLQFSPSAWGTGSFIFTPAAGADYQAVIRTADGRSVVRQLPVIADQGYTVHLSDDAAMLKITLRCNLPAVRQAFIFIHTREAVKISQQVAMVNGEADLSVDKNMLGDGLSEILVFNDQQKIVSKRLYFKNPLKRLLINVASDTPVYTERKKIHLSFHAGRASTISVAVYRSEELVMQDNDPEDYLLLWSELANGAAQDVPSTADSSAAARRALDDYLITCKDSRAGWNTMASTSIQYMPEIDGHLVTGTVTNLSGLPVAGVYTELSIPGARGKYYFSESDSAGRIKFDLRNYYGPGKVVLRASDSSHVYRINIDSAFARQPGAGGVSPSGPVQDSLNEQQVNEAIGLQVQNIFLPPAKEFIAVADTLPFYGKNCVRYNLDYYTRFTKMEEVLREFINEVALRKEEGKFQMRVKDFVHKSLFGIRPLILVDGVAMSEDQVLQVDPLKIRTLEVVPSNYLLGPNVYGGVINLVSFRGAVEDLPLGPDNVVLPYDGLLPATEFISPAYQTSEQAGSRIPDFRRLLNWSPSVNTNREGNADLEFYTSDVPGRYVVVAEGFDDEGHAGSGFCTFEVKDE